MAFFSYIHTFLTIILIIIKKTLLYVLALVCVCRLVSRSKPECRTLVTAASFWSKRPELCRSPRLTVLLSGSSLIVPVQSQRRYCSVNKMGPPYLIKNTLCFFKFCSGFVTIVLPTTEAKQVILVPSSINPNPSG